MEKQSIVIPPIQLSWSEWVPWGTLKLHALSRQGVVVPQYCPGVYEVRLIGAQERLTIGKASDLRMRIKGRLLKGRKHSSGERILANEDTSRVEVRWAFTDRPAAVEEDLHKIYKARFGCLPRYTQHT
jgi:hypothetical protein